MYQQVEFIRLLVFTIQLCGNLLNLLFYVPCRNCSVSINDLRGGQRHDMWLALQNIKMGRVHLAITVIEEDLQKVSSLLLLMILVHIGA